jgi:hypothetical protein
MKGSNHCPSGCILVVSHLLSLPHSTACHVHGHRVSIMIDRLLKGLAANLGYLSRSKKILKKKEAVHLA